MIGRRVHADSSDDLHLEAGDYGIHPVDGNWYACAPDGKMANLSLHSVIEHDDGTITVSPSILITAHDGQWHGFLERGIWREA